MVTLGMRMHYCQTSLCGGDGTRDGRAIADRAAAGHIWKHLAPPWVDSRTASPMIGGAPGSPGRAAARWTFRVREASESANGGDVRRSPGRSMPPRSRGVLAAVEGRAERSGSPYYIIATMLRRVPCAARASIRHPRLLPTRLVFAVRGESGRRSCGDPCRCSWCNGMKDREWISSISPFAWVRRFSLERDRMQKLFPAAAFNERSKGYAEVPRADRR
jgi:hypothetical protein